MVSDIQLQNTERPETSSIRLGTCGLAPTPTAILNDSIF